MYYDITRNKWFKRGLLNELINKQIDKTVMIL